MVAAGEGVLYNGVQNQKGDGRMKRTIAALLGLLMALPTAYAAEHTWYTSESTLRMAAAEPLTLSVQAEGFEGTLALQVPKKEEADDLPLAAVFFTLKEASVAAADEKEAAGKLNRLFLLPGGVEAAFEQKEQGFALTDALPVMVKERALFDGAKAVFGGDAVKLADIAAAESYQPLKPAYLGYATSRSDCNVREGAAQNTRRVAVVKKGTALPVIGEEKGWHQVLLPDGQKGYMAPKVVSFEPLKAPDSVAALVESGDTEGARAVLAALGLDGAAATLSDYARFTEALNMLRQGDYAAARAAYEQLGAFGGADARAKRMEGLESLPKDILLHGAEAENATCELQIKAGRAGDPYCVKIYRTGEKEAAFILFVPSGGTASVRLPLGGYSLAYASGSLWYGTEKFFGEQGRYARLDDPILLEKDGTRCVLTFAPEEKPNGAHTPVDLTAF